MVYDLMPIRTSEPMWSQSRLQGGCWYGGVAIIQGNRPAGDRCAQTRNGAAGGGLGVDVLSPVIVGKAPGHSQLNRNTIWLCQSTQAPGSPQRASWPFRLNAVTLIVGLPPTDSNASTMHLV